MFGSGGLIGLGWVLLPLLLVVATAFTKASMVMGALRLGLGAEGIFPVPVVFAASVVVAALVMAPTGQAVWANVQTAGGPDAVMSGVGAWGEVFAPWIQFLARHASVDEAEFFAELEQRDPTAPWVLVPAFLVTELREAMTMAVVVIVPFVLIDLLVAQVLVLWGLSNQPTPIVTVPLKLLLFLAVDGWDVVVGGLVEGYR